MPPVASTRPPAIDPLPPDPGEDPDGVRPRPRYLTATEQPARVDTRPLGFLFPDALDSPSWHEVRATRTQRPADMPVERVNIILQRDCDVDERGMDGPAPPSAGLFLHVALATWNPETAQRGKRTHLIYAHRDDGAAVSLANPYLMTEEERKLIPWIPSDRKILSATNHDVQGVGNNLMCKLMLCFPDEKG